GVSGALIGVPLGVGFAWLMVTVFDEQLPSGLEVPPGMLLFAGIGSVAAGLIGAAYPAVRVVRVSPLKALTGRAEPTKPAAIGRVLGFALAGIALQFAIVAFSQSRETLFWSYATAGLPAMFIGYFLLSVPIMIGASYALSGPLSKLLGLPPRVLGRTVRATPFRHGFTAGAMMTGLALMVSIWTNGGSILRDWLNNIEFPDAFVNGLRLQPEAQERIRALPFVTNTCSIALHSIETDAFGIEGLSNYRTTFIAFEPEPFFAMTNVEFLQGDAETAERRLEEGGTIIVSKEFTAAQGLGVGDTFVCRDNGETFEFEIVGVVTSPGLELASKFFNIGEEYLDQAIHAVFGSRKDLRERFNSDATQLIQVAFDNDELVRLARERGGPDIDPDYWATQQIKEATLDLGVLDAGSGRRIKSRIGTFIGATLVVFSGVAVVSMLVACFGVANLIIAGIESRQFEFGVLRAVGAQRGMLARLVAAEAILVAVTASIVGTLMGMQTAWAGSRLYELIAGLEMRFTPPVGAIAFGWGVVLLFTVGAALPAIFRLNGRQTRELLAATRG
ncbi:MAG: FtsX-like permease family protein, partial [Planctomycetota bacterium]